ncbi:TD and POZ domain-containing protein 2 [Trichonephila clavipes]|nr:TD and POZ domain-containing protein 2 [Trichonephila clavipes]
MDCDSLSENTCFTFTWKVENFGYSSLKNGEYFLSPLFFVDTMGKSRWRLKLYPKGNGEDAKDFISFFLVRDRTCKGPLNVGVHFELSFIGADDSILEKTGPFENTFSHDMSWGFADFAKQDDVLKVGRKYYLPGNILTARCRIALANEITNYGHCYARTLIGVEFRTFTWNFEQFSSFHESTCNIYSDKTNNPIVTLKSFTTNDSFIHVEVCGYDYTLKYSTLRIYFVDTSGNRTECLYDEFYYDESIQTTVFPLTISKNELMKNKNLYLPNDVLQLYCECAFSSGIRLVEKIEKIISVCSPLMQEENLSSDSFKSKKIRLESKQILGENLETLYKENLLCDLKLKTKTGSFPVHKNILSARSPVFKAMFTYDGKEKNSECVNIDDLDDDTIQRMLHFIYTAKLQDLQWDSACNLYAAAVKYEIISLKSECFSFLEDNLTQDNACDLLIFADKQLDENLKSIIQDYILIHKNIFQSKEWKLFMETNLQLAVDLMYRKCTEKM